MLHPFFSQRKTDKSPPVSGHEVDGLRSDLLSRHTKVTLVFAVFVIHQDDHPAFADVLDGLFNGSQWHRIPIYPSKPRGSTLELVLMELRWLHDGNSRVDFS